MKKIKVDFSLPAFLSDFSQDEINEKFTRAKLKVMYIGETRDKRLFTEKFAQDLIKTLPYTPVVSHYDSEKDDFVGHHTEQAIYGIVDPLIAPVFEKDEDGKTWAIASVILYTERPDATGDIAKKIVGKSQSLEMDPNTVEYNLNYEGKMFKNVEFTKGSFIGLSVLGENQKPAFLGSAFFTEQSASAFAQLKEYCSNRGKDKMNVEEIYSFIELSWGEKYKVIAKALDEKYGEFKAHIVDFYDTHVVAWIYSEDGKEAKMMKINYAFDDKAIASLSEAQAVKVAYEPVQSVAQAAEPMPEQKEEVKPEEQKPEMVEAKEHNEDDDYPYDDEEKDDDENWDDMMSDLKTLADLNLKPTTSMANNAKRGLELRREYKRGGTAVGVARARDLSNRKDLSPDTVRRMYSYFSRHEVDKKGKGWKPGSEGYPSNGLIAWLLWGGDSGFSWARSKWNQIKRIRGQAEQIAELMTVTEKEMEESVVKQLKMKFGEGVEVIQWSSVDDMVVYKDPKDGLIYRVSFIMEQETETLTWNEPELVKERYVTEKEIETLWKEPEVAKEELPQAEVKAPEQEPKNEEIVNAAIITEVVPNTAIQTTPAEVMQTAPETVTQTAPSTVVQAAPATVVEAVVETKDAIKDDDQKQEVAANSTSLVESEQEELKAYRLKEKLSLIETYAKVVPEHVLSNYKATADIITLADLKVKLNEEFVKHSKKGIRIKTTFLSISPEKDTTKRPDIKDLVEKYK